MSIPVIPDSDGATFLTNVNAAMQTIYSDQQLQVAGAFATGGTAPAYTLTPSPAPASYVAKQRFNVIVHADGTNVQPTINVAGLGAKNWMQRGPTGVLVPAALVAGALLDIEYDGTYWVTLNPLPPRQIQPLTATVGSSAMTVTLGQNVLDFRSAAPESGDSYTRGVIGASLVVPQGATLGTVSGVQSRIAVLALDNAGTVEVAVVNLAGGNNLDETTLISTTAISSSSNSANVVYSAAARNNLAFRVVGYIESTQATAGNWASAPSKVQGAGGQAFTALSSLGFGQTWNSVSRTVGTTYYNTTPKPIVLAVAASVTSAQTGAVYVTINGTVVTVAQGGQSGGSYNQIAGNILIPPGVGYVITTNSYATVTNTWELR
jgi:hypothetical protein